MRCESHTPGSFCTTVLRTCDPQRAAAFYNTLGGWTVEPVAGSRQHFLMLFKGIPVAAIQDVFDGQDEWVPHVSVADIDGAVSRALELGATLVDTSAVTGLARLATLRDVEGARFGMWQPAPNHGAELMEEIGSLWWLELISRETEAARHGVQARRRAGRRTAANGSRMGHQPCVELDLRRQRLRRHAREGQSARSLNHFRAHCPELGSHRRIRRPGRRVVSASRCGAGRDAVRAVACRICTTLDTTVNAELAEYAEILNPLRVQRFLR